MGLLKDNERKKTKDKKLKADYDLITSRDGELKISNNEKEVSPMKTETKEKIAEDREDTTERMK